jgi:hypothetical protein
MAMKVHFDKENKQLIITIPVDNWVTNDKIPARPSVTGKTFVVASTHGNVPTPLEIRGKLVTVGVNAYISAKQ